MPSMFDDSVSMQDLPPQQQNVTDSGKFFTDVHPSVEGSSATSFLEREAALMTTEERREALQTVRDRLASLRAARESEKQVKEGNFEANNNAITEWKAQPESLQAA